MPKLVSTLSQCLPAWRREHSDLPTLTWTTFHCKTRELVNPLVSEERMRMVASALDDMGEVGGEGREGEEGGREGEVREREEGREGGSVTGEGLREEEREGGRVLLGRD